MRKSGIDAAGDIPWGTHFCHFYENKRDLLDVLVPYFTAGLEQNEFCVWAVFDPLDEREARNELERAWPGARERLAAGDIEIVPQSRWVGGEGEQLARDWEARLDQALARGYAGMRVNARSLGACEGEFGRLVADRRMILLCAHPLGTDRATDIFGGRGIHRLAIARRNGDWQVVETPELSQARADIKELERRSRCYLDLGLVGMATISPAIGCIEVNARLCEILGYEQSELMRMTWAGLVHPDDLAGDIGDYERIVTGEVEGYRMPKRWIRKNGEVVHTNVSVKCRRRPDGSVDFLAAMVEEVAPLEVEISRRSAQGHAGGKDLSGRERQVARLIGMGRTVKEIASALALSEKTVSTYRSRILTKLNLSTTAELIRYALQHDLAY